MNFKKLLIYTTLTIAMLWARNATSQCIIDSTQTQPGIHPDSLLNGTVNQYYSQDVTFVLITDTLGLNISNFNIASINGLPLGINWSCNNAANGCNYDPNLSLYGCVRIYGTPLIPGSYPLSITVIATVALIGNQTFNFTAQITIDPASSNNTGFLMSNSLGCAPLSVSFTNNLPGGDYYNWDFGNGDSSNLENPGATVYTQAGDYIVKQVSIADTLPSYFLTNVKIDSIPNNAGFFDTPDIYILVKSPLGVTVFDSHPSISNTNPPVNISIPSLQLNNGIYTIEVWDEDSGLTLPDDPLGTISFQGHSSSDTVYSTLTGISGKLKLIYALQVQQPIVNIAIDTVHVYPGITAPFTTAGGPTTFCDGDTVVLNSNFNGSNQWFKNGNLIVGETNTTLVVTTTGNYFDVVSNAQGCKDTSATVAVNVNFLPPYPNFSINNNLLTANVFGTYFFQWYLNDTLIPGANSNSYTALVSGNYRLQLKDQNGCKRKSFAVPVVVSGIFDVDMSALIQVYPNPAKAEITIAWNEIKTHQLQIEIYDSYGKKMFGEMLEQSNAVHQIAIDISAWSKGVYFVNLTDERHFARKKLIVN